jgi:hypothetical protein
MHLNAITPTFFILEPAYNCIYTIKIREQGKKVILQMFFPNGSCRNIYYFNALSSMLGESLGASSGDGWRRRPPDMEGSCEYIE